MKSAWALNVLIIIILTESMCGQDIDDDHDYDDDEEDTQAGRHLLPVVV